MSTINKLFENAHNLNNLETRLSKRRVSGAIRRRINAGCYYN
jgi:hypothetical protein